MTKIAIVVGHGYGDDKGAVGPNGTLEYNWNLELAKCIVEQLPNSVLVLRDVPYHKLAGKINSLGVDYALELHCNSFRLPTATGIETLYWHTSSNGKTLASKVQKTLVDVLKLADRGVKPKQNGDRGARILRDTSMPTVIVETFFISNPNDLLVANANKKRLAKELAKTLGEL